MDNTSQMSMALECLELLPGENSSRRPGENSSRRRSIIVLSQLIREFGAAQIRDACKDIAAEAGKCKPIKNYVAVLVSRIKRFKQTNTYKELQVRYNGQIDSRVFVKELKEIGFQAISESIDHQKSIPTTTPMTTHRKYDGFSTREELEECACACLSEFTRGYSKLTINLYAKLICEFGAENIYAMAKAFGHEIADDPGQIMNTSAVFIGRLKKLKELVSEGYLHYDFPNPVDETSLISYFTALPVFMQGSHNVQP